MIFFCSGGLTTADRTWIDSAVIDRRYSVHFTIPNRLFCAVIFRK
jgi:hypothetical protein